MHSDERWIVRAPAMTPGCPALLLEWHVGEGERLREGQRRIGK